MLNLNKVASILLIVSCPFVVSCKRVSVPFIGKKKSATNQEEQWTMLFDGKSLDGWIQRGGQAKYSIVDGAIVGHTVANSPNSFLCTERDYADFELEYEFKIENMNSGVQIRSNSLVDYKKGVVHGYQVEIDPSHRSWTAGIYDESRRGWLYPKMGDKSVEKAFSEQGRRIFKKNEWNKVRVRADGDHIQTWLNDELRADLVDDMTAFGFIALQVHADKSVGREVAWRNIRIRVLHGSRKNKAG